MGLHFPVFALALKDLVDRPEDEVDGFFLRGLVGLDVDLRSFGGLVRGRDSGELGDLAPAGLGVQALHVAGFADRQRGVDEDLDERVVREGGAGLGAVGGQRSDERDERDVARAGEEAGDGGGATDAFGAVGGGEA